jgi:palmitoyl-protein thioesterase
MMTSLLFLIAFLSTAVTAERPIVLMHGIESNAGNMVELADWVSVTFNRQVVNVELGDGDSYSTDTPMWEQIDAFREVVSNLTDGFDFIGISQGGLIGRGYVARHNSPPVANLITLVSPHGGVYDKNLGFIDFYSPIAQSTLSFAGYWRDPTEPIKYHIFSSFLPAVNGEKPLRRNKYLQSLTNFAMVFSPNDEIIKPPSSGIFDTYDSNLAVVALENNPIYTEDWIGLKLLNETGRLHTFQTNCTHVEHRMPVCFSQLYPIFAQFLTSGGGGGNGDKHIFNSPREATL